MAEGEVKELSGGTFLADVARRTHDAQVLSITEPLFNFAEACGRPTHELREGETARHRFGVYRPETAAALRKLADLIDEGRALPQKASHETRAAADDFVMESVTLEFAMKVATIDG